jgi:HK97 family phage major capsid protein
MFIQLKSEHFGKPAGERLDVDEKSAQALITAGIAEAVTGSPIQDLINKQLEAGFARTMKAFDDALNATLKKFQEAQSHPKKFAVPAIFGDQKGGDPNHCFGDWCLAVALAGRGAPAARKRLEDEYGSKFQTWGKDAWEGAAWSKAAMAESSGSTGGYIVPPEFYQGILAVMSEETFIRPRAFVQPMGSATLQIPYLDITTAQSAGVSPFFGGVKMRWTAEAQTRQETEPQFKQLELRAWELSGYSVSSNVLLQDSVFGLEKFLLMLFARAIGWFEEYAFLQGTGAGQPQGILGAPATIAVNRLNAGQIGFSDMATMWSKLLPISWGRAIWTFSPSVVPQLLQLKDGAGRAIFISIDQGATKSPVWNLLGRPAFPTEKVPALGTKGDLMAIDPALYVIGDRMQIEIAASEHVNFLANQMTWRVVERVDGQPWMDKPITLQDTSTQVSPFVALN